MKLLKSLPFFALAAFSAAAITPASALPASSSSTTIVDEAMDLVEGRLACGAAADEPVAWAGLQVAGVGSFHCPGEVTVEVVVTWNGLTLGKSSASGRERVSTTAVSPLCAPGFWQTVALGNGIAIGSSNQVFFLPDDCIPLQERP